MNIMEKIYEAYIASELNIKPKSPTPEEREAVKKCIEKCKLTEEQALYFDGLLLDTIDRRGKEMFFAGFRLAIEFMNAISADTENGIGQ